LRLDVFHALRELRLTLRLSRCTASELPKGLKRLSSRFGSRDSHLDKLPGFGEFRLLEDPKLRITHFMLATLSGKTEASCYLVRNAK